MNGLSTIKAINDAAVRKARGIETQPAGEQARRDRATRADKVREGQRRARGA